jgi:hypothetical protein
MQRIDTNTFPPGGWQYYQPQTQWNAPNPLINSFAVQVRTIRDHRAANPKAALDLDTAQIEADLLAFTRARLKLNPVAPFEISPDKPKRRKGCGTCGGR